MNIYQILFYSCSFLITLYYELVYLEGAFYEPCSGLKENLNNFSLININKPHNNKFIRVASVRQNLFKRHSFIILLRVNKNDKKYNTYGLYNVNRTNQILSPDYNFQNCSNKTTELHFHTNWTPIYSTDYLLDIYINNFLYNKSQYKYYNSADFVINMFNRLSKTELDCTWKFGLNIEKYCKEI